MAEPVFQFGDFRLDCSAFTLLRNEHELRIERKPMELLILLVSRQGQLVTREEIARHLWSSEIFVDTEHGINTAIRKIRHVLRDDPDAPRILQTVTGKGYRMICSVERLNGRQTDQSEAAISSPSPLPLPGRAVPDLVPLPTEGVRMSKRMKLGWVVFSGLAVAALLMAVGFRYRQLPTLRVAEFAAITHDGSSKSLAGTDGSRIYLTSPVGIGEVAVSGGDIVPLKVALPGSSLLDVSTDGSSLLVGSDDKGRWSLWNVRVPSGSIQHIVDAPVWNAAWSPDGKSLAYATADGELFVSNSDGTGAHRIYSAGHTEFLYNVAAGLVWSPDGSRIRFTRGNGIWEISASGDGLHEVLPGWRPDAVKCCGRWTPDGRTFLFLVKDDVSDPLLPGSQLWAISERRGIAAGPPTQFAPGPIRWDTPVPSKDGKKIFARGVILRGELVRYDRKSKQLQPWLGGISAEAVSFSSVDDSIAYVTFPEGILWRANRDGSNRVQLTSPPMYPFGVHFSPDGTRILFFCFTGDNKVKSYLVPARGGGPPQLLLPEDAEQQIDPSWSPDGKQIVFGWPDWARGNTKHVLRILDLKSRHVETLPDSHGMWSPRWSPNGRYIACLNSSGGISMFDLQKQQWRAIQPGERDYPTWSSDSRFLYFVNMSGLPGVYRIPIAGGSPERIVDLTGFHSTGAVFDWFGLDPNDTPMLLRDAGSDDIYALTVEGK